MKFRKLAILAVLPLAGAQMVSAQSMNGDRGVEFGASTLGAYVSADYVISPNVAVRVPLYFGSYEGEFDLDGNDMDADLDVASMSAMLDFYLADTGFRVSTGLSIGGYSVTSSVDEVEFDGTTYNADFEFEVAQASNIAPTVAVGYRKIFSDKWGLSAELGARLTRLELEASGQDDLTPAEKANFEQDIEDFNDDLKSVGVIPFLSVGLNYRF